MTSTATALPTTSAATVFRIAAFFEAATWLGLLVGMFVKYVLGGGDGGVALFGRVHGVVVLAYVGVAVWTSRRLRWADRTLLLSLFASVPPCGTIFFERWATRSGRFERRRRAR